MGGETMTHTCWNCGKQGLSPRGRGNQTVQSWRQTQRRSIPAWADARGIGDVPDGGSLGTAPDPAPSPSFGELTQTVTSPLYPVGRVRLLLGLAPHRQFHQNLHGNGPCITTWIAAGVPATASHAGSPPSMNCRPVRETYTFMERLRQLKSRRAAAMIHTPRLRNTKVTFRGKFPELAFSRYLIIRRVTLTSTYRVRRTPSCIRSCVLIVKPKRTRAKMGVLVERARQWRPSLLMITAIVAIAVVLAWLLLTIWPAISQIAEVDRRISTQITLGKTVAEFILGAAAVVAIWLTSRRVTAAERTVEVAQEGQITERFTRAIDQLGSDKVPIRLGGIYALERIARDSGKDHWQVMQVLMDCVPRKPEPDNQTGEDLPKQPVSSDIQAILEVLGRLNTKHDEPWARLNLRKADLRRMDLRATNLAWAILVEADLRGAILDRANLQGANLAIADVRGTWLSKSDLREAKLNLADFRGADLTKADLKGANLNGANFMWGPLSYIGGRLESTVPGSSDHRTQFVGAKFKGATVRNAYFQGADLTDANFEGADLTGSRFQRAFVLLADNSSYDNPSFNTVLTRANFCRADMTGADIRHTDLGDALGLTQAQIDSAISDGTTKLPGHLFAGRKNEQGI